MGRRKKGRKPRGFSERPFKSAYDRMLGKIGVKGPEKRALFNDL